MTEIWSYILLFLLAALAALAGFAVAATFFKDKLPANVQPFADLFNEWRGSITYDQVLWAASLLMALSKSKTLTNLGGPFEAFRKILETISRFFYNVAGDWMAVTMKEEEK